MGGQGDWDKAAWRKSSRSGSDDSAGCVALAAAASRGAVRDTRDPCRTILVLPGTVMRELLADIKKGTFDLR